MQTLNGPGGLDRTRCSVPGSMLVLIVRTFADFMLPTEWSGPRTRCWNSRARKGTNGSTPVYRRKGRKMMTRTRTQTQTEMCSLAKGAMGFACVIVDF